MLTANYVELGGGESLGYLSGAWLKKVRAMLGEGRIRQRFFFFLDLGSKGKVDGLYDYSGLSRGQILPKYTSLNYCHTIFSFFKQKEGKEK